MIKFIQYLMRSPQGMTLGSHFVCFLYSINRPKKREINCLMLFLEEKEEEEEDGDKKEIL